MEMSEVSAKVGDQVRVEFETYNKAYEVTGELKEITLNCVRVNSIFVNIARVININIKERI